MAGKMKKSEASSSNSSSRREKGESVVVDWGRRKSTCGYCRSGSCTSINHGLWAHSITTDEYHDLLDRGWRRYGYFLYKPKMERTCCPSHTIRLKASDFVPSKEQLAYLEKCKDLALTMGTTFRFLDGTLEHRKPGEHIADPNVSKGIHESTHDRASGSVKKDSLARKDVYMNEEKHFLQHLSDQIINGVQMCIESGEFPRDVQFPRPSVKRVSQARRKMLVEGPKDLMYSSNMAFQIVAMIRREKLGKLTVDMSKSSEHNAEENGLSLKMVAEKLASSLHQVEELSGLSIEACNGHINFYSAKQQASTPESLPITVSKQSASDCESKKCIIDISPGPQKNRRRLEIRMKKSSFDPEEYALYRRYQIKVHNGSPDRVTESSYMRFLVETPLIFVPPTGDGTVPPCGFGSFHQQYVIDGKLVAVGVVDVLPRCLSSKYLFWDPDFAFLSLGKYAAQQEIDWVKENEVHCASLQYYYLGYYIHTCSKMIYKASYRPSELLCPLHYQWIPFHIAKPLLGKKRYVALSDFPILQNGDLLPFSASKNVMESQDDGICQEDANDVQMDEDDFESSDEDSELETNGLASSERDGGDASKILIGLKGSPMRYKDIQRAFGSAQRNYLEDQLHRYKRVVGAELSERMVYSLG